MAKRTTSLRDYFSVANSSPSSRVQENTPEALPESAEETAEEADLPVKRVRCHARLSGFNKEWQTSYPWVQVSVDGQGMFCKLCRKHSRRPKKVPVGKASWVDVPCVTLQQSSLKRHEASQSHNEAKALEVQLCISRDVGGIEQAFHTVESAERKAMISAMKCLYFLCKNEIPHTTNFVSLLELAKSIGATYLCDLNLGGNAHYTSERFMQEAVSSLGVVIRNKIFDDIRSSPFFSLLCDETTDVAVKKELIVYARYLNSDRQICTSFISLLEVPNGTASTIFSALQKLCEEEGFDIDGKLVAFGSDGAAVMIGRHSGVATLLKQKSPWLIANHCVAHRLALASAQAADAVPYVKKFKAILDQLYRFYDNSAVRTAALKLIQDILEDPRLKLTQAKDVRWLSHEHAVNNLRKCLKSVITSLEREADERHDAQALGLATFVKTYNFVATLLMLSDILPPLATLSRAFQRKDLDYSLVKPLVSGTLASLHNLKASPGQHFSCLDKVLDEDLAGFNISVRHSLNFKENVYDKYLDAVESHLQRRFPDMELIEAFSVFDGKSWPENHQGYGHHHLITLSTHFTDALINKEELMGEWELFKNSAGPSFPFHSMNAQEVMTTLVSRSDLSNLFPNLFKLALAALLIPTSTADCERGFSALKRVKSPLRNRLSNIITVHLLFITMEGPPLEHYDFDAACTDWGSKRNRRINVVN